MKRTLCGAFLGALLLATGARAETLVIAGRDGAFASAVKLAAESYKAKNPGIEIQQLELAGGPLLEKETIALREKSGAYDVIMLDDIWAPEFMSKGWLADLDKLGGGVSEDFVRPARDVSRHPVGEGPYFAVPFVGNVEMYAYRQDLFDKYGIARPENWAQVRAAAEAIQSKEQGVSGLVFRGVKGNPIVSGFLPILLAFGGEVIDKDGRAGLASPAAVEALEFFLALKKSAPKGVETYNATEVQDALRQGTAAIATELWPGWAAPLDDPAKSKVPGLITIAPPPGQAAGPAPLLGAWLLAVPADSKNAARARDFIDFLTSPEMQKELALKIGTPPTRTSVYSDPEVIGKYRWFPAQYQALLAARPRPRITQWAQVETILGDYLQLALLEQMEPKQALEEANEKIARSLKR
jgi:multiple sugar transport system substrate-binding protein